MTYLFSKRGQITSQILEDAYDDQIYYDRYSDIYDRKDIFSVNVQREILEKIKIGISYKFIDWKNAGFNPHLNEGTYTNFAQTEQKIYLLHVYFMYLKFGFGRTTQDAGIEIRRGAMTREQAKNLVTMYDGVFPEQHLENYLKIF